VDAGKNIATIAIELKKNRKLDAKSKLPTELLMKANQLYRKLSEE